VKNNDDGIGESSSGSSLDISVDLATKHSHTRTHGSAKKQVRFLYFFPVPTNKKYTATLLENIYPTIELDGFNPYPYPNQHGESKQLPSILIKHPGPSPSSRAVAEVTVYASTAHIPTTTPHMTDTLIRIANKEIKK